MNIVNQNIDTRVPQGPFGLSFLSWQGNNISFSESSWLIYILLLLTFLSFITFFFFKTPLRRFYLTHQKIMIAIFQLFGFFIISLSIFRGTILFIGKYPNLWELVPFHFCRFFIIIICFFLCFRKIDALKYVGLFSICGGIVGLLIADLNSSPYWEAKGGVKLGYDSYIFWDYFIIHISAVLVPAYLFITNRFMISKWNVGISAISLISFTIGIFFMDWMFSYLPNEQWRANWFYVGPDHVNGIDDLLSKFLGPIARWPLILFLFIGIGIGLYTGSIAIYFWQDKYEIDLKSKGKKIVKTNSKAKEYFKNSNWI